VSVSQDREHMSRIGRAGGRSSRAGRSGRGVASSAGADQKPSGGRMETHPTAA
jgi:general stress protein YciG